MADLEKLIAAEAALTIEPGRWQPIETAPKDRLIDVWLKDGVRWCDCYYDRITDTWRTSRPSGHLLSIQSSFVSHWMDRPPPPAANGRGIS